MPLQDPVGQRLVLPQAVQVVLVPSQLVIRGGQQRQRLFRIFQRLLKLGPLQQRPEGAQSAVAFQQLQQVLSGRHQQPVNLVDRRPARVFLELGQRGALDERTGRPHVEEQVSELQKKRSHRKLTTTTQADVPATAPSTATSSRGTSSPARGSFPCRTTPSSR